MFFDTLYKRTATGAIQQWVMELDDETGRYRTISGQVDGAKVVSEWTVPKAKNEGRSNATDPIAQGKREALAAWQKKQRTGYSRTVNDAQGSTRFQCMLAQNYSDARRKKEALAAAHSGILYSQPKLDGIRCIASPDSLLSRKGTALVSVPHIAEALAYAFADHPGDIVFDGELYNHALKDDFNEIVSIVRKGKPTAGDLEISRAKAQYHIYDCYVPSRAAMSFFDRWSLLRQLLGHDSHPHLKLVPTLAVNSEEMIDREYDDYLAEGLEGQMLRIDGSYEQKRSPLLLKRKEFEDAEFRIVSIQEGEGNKSGMAGFVWVEDASFKRFKANVKGDRDFCRKLLEERKKYEGGEVTIRFNGRTPDGVPRFPRALHDKWWPYGRDV